MLIFLGLMAVPSASTRLPSAPVEEVVEVDITVKVVVDTTREATVVVDMVAARVAVVGASKIYCFIPKCLNRWLTLDNRN